MSTDNPLGWKPWQVRLNGLYEEQAQPRLLAPGNAMPRGTLYSIPPSAVRYPNLGQLAPSARHLSPQSIDGGYVPTATLPLSGMGTKTYGILAALATIFFVATFAGEGRALLRGGRRR
jgi:hypothetical protein